jgi:hypothetical protein
LAQEKLTLKSPYANFNLSFLLSPTLHKRPHTETNDEDKRFSRESGFFLKFKTEEASPKPKIFNKDKKDLK